MIGEFALFICLEVTGMRTPNVVAFEGTWRVRRGVEHRYQCCPQVWLEVSVVNL